MARALRASEIWSCRNLIGSQSKKKNDGQVPEQRAKSPSLRVCLIEARWGEKFVVPVPDAGDVWWQPQSPCFVWHDIESSSSFCKLKIDDTKVPCDSWWWRKILLHTFEITLPAKIMSRERKMSMAGACVWSQKHVEMRSCKMANDKTMRNWWYKWIKKDKIIMKKRWYNN
jgi:hypothetical protein